jgi:hypothetical protein
VDGLNEKAFFRLSRDDGRPAVAAPQEGVAVVQEQAALVFSQLGGVAALAAFGEDGADPALEELDVRRSVGTCSCRLLGGCRWYATDCDENDG